LTTLPYSNQVEAMFGEGHHDSIVQPGIDEALACQDMLERTPATPSRLSRVIARVVAAARLLGLRNRVEEHRVTPAPPYGSR
jgi:hypothetical protein